MIEPRMPIFQWGQKVWAETDLYNDGSYPDREPDALLVAAGTEGEIVQVGYHEEANIPVYLVEFPNGCVVGCFEEELRAEHGKGQVAGLI
ncbi:nitrogen fixation protein NifZ [Methylocaldum szegediense]|uniref:Nitrogen fixation protein NifZ n=1 Tax=Methylocaldum szegediense TaxID=73780 RepID=A0ABN8XEJ6_9GAMM|nr:nitrogen fixation protein NifZ [Methylocaldum szegediense]CAI8962588.1 nitrogen fixation protein NifZ [Methylocaldum szegediense]